MSKEIRFDDAARAALRRGIDRVADTVKVTLGPCGRSIVIDHGGAPTLTNDGITVIRQIELPDPIENLGAALMREVSGRTQDLAGDGTTTAVVLTQALIDLGFDAVAAGARPVALKRGIDRAVEAVVRELQRIGKPLRSEEQIAQVAALAANREQELGQLVAEAVGRLGAAGIISVREVMGLESSLEITAGLQFPGGYLSPYFVNRPEEMRVELRNCWVLVHDRPMTSLSELLPALELSATFERPLLLVTEELDGDALSTLVVNRLKGSLEVCAVRAPGFGERRREIMEDLALLTGGVVLPESGGRGLASLSPTDFGRAGGATIERDSTTVIQGGGTREEIEARRRDVRRRLEALGSGAERDRLEARLQRLEGAVGVLRVGGLTEAELRERRERAEDALAAARAAMSEGIVAGGGVALLGAGRAALRLDLSGDEALGARIVAAALEAPARTIARNAGHSPDEAAAEVERSEGRAALNVLTGRYEDFEASGIVDPVKVVRVALQNAGSIAGMILTTDCLITETDEEGPPHDSA